jgi:hypothetical protein
VLERLEVPFVSPQINAVEVRLRPIENAVEAQEIADRRGLIRRDGRRVRQGEPPPVDHTPRIAFQQRVLLPVRRYLLRQPGIIIGRIKPLTKRVDRQQFPDAIERKKSGSIRHARASMSIQITFQGFAILWDRSERVNRCKGSQPRTTPARRDTMRTSPHYRA